ncbi:MAG: hypothetical protein L3K23_09840 [Thermoplasmata archaeon]|nr:hypothetical protein [Thermoplasmata archaeon]
MALASSTVAVLLVTLAVLPAPIRSSSSLAEAANVFLNESRSTENPVLFGLNLSSGSGIGVDFQFGARIDLSGGNISPGQTVNASATLSVPTSTRVAVSYLGTSTSVSIAPIGALVNYPIPGLNLQYLGVPLTLYLNLSATITGNSSVTGPGGGGGGALNWSSAGERSFPVTASANAAPGSVLASTVSGLRYTVALGVDAGAQIPLLGHYVVHLLTLGHVGLFPGIPSAVQSEYVVPSPPHANAGGWLSGPAGQVALAGVVGVVAVTALLSVLLWRRKRRG